MAKNNHKLPPPGKQLSVQQREFVMALAADPKHCQKSAAIAAGYSPKTAITMASQLMTLPKYAHVQAEFQRLMAARLAKYEVTKEGIERELAMIAFGDRTRISRLELVPVRNPDGSPALDEIGNHLFRQEVVVTPTADLFPDERAMVLGYREKAKNDGHGTMIEVIQTDKVGALKTLAKIKGMLVQKHEVKLDMTLAAAAAAEESFLGKLDKLAKAAQANESEPELATPGESPQE